MNNQSFIPNKINTGLTGKCNSLSYDGSHFYSYGSHYPLLVKVGEHYLLNDAGYSVTTGKHISLASPYASYVYNQAYMTRDYIQDSERTNPVKILEAVNNEIKSLESEIEQLSTRAWKQKEIKEARIAKLKLTQEYLLGLTITI